MPDLWRPKAEQRRQKLGGRDGMAASLNNTVDHLTTT
jgi:hypothetical protein